MRAIAGITPLRGIVLPSVRRESIVKPNTRHREQHPGQAARTQRKPAHRVARRKTVIPRPRAIAGLACSFCVVPGVCPASLAPALIVWRVKPPTRTPKPARRPSGPSLIAAVPLPPPCPSSAAPDRHRLNLAPPHAVGSVDRWSLDSWRTDRQDKDVARRDPRDSFQPPGPADRTCVLSVAARPAVRCCCCCCCARTVVPVEPACPLSLPVAPSSSARPCPCPCLCLCRPSRSIANLHISPNQSATLARLRITVPGSRCATLELYYCCASVLAGSRACNPGLVSHPSPAVSLQS